jgi:hypothetical protein
MKILMSVLAIIALGLTIIPSFFVFNGTLEMGLYKNLMTTGTLLWFVSAPIWFRKKKVSD